MSMKSSSIILMPLAVIGFLACSSPEGRQLVRALPPEARIALESPDSIEALLVRSDCDVAQGELAPNSASLRTIAGHLVRTSVPVALDLGRSAASRVLRADSFFTDTRTCVFCPHHILLFHRGSKSVAVALCYDCLDCGQVEVFYTGQPPWSSGVVVMTAEAHRSFRAAFASTPLRSTVK
jgi:hypothetical protein